jgi:predicted permease
MNCHDLLQSLRAVFSKRHTDLELDEELASHIELQTRKYINQGMPPGAALRRARIDFGALENTKEECREARRPVWFSNGTRDLQYALRAFRRAPGFTALIVGILALAMGANLSTFSVADALLLRMLPVKDPASLFRTVRASGTPDAGGGDGASYHLLQEMQRRTGPFAELMAYQPAEAAAVSIGHAEQERLMQQTVTGDYFRVLGVQAVIGRTISAEDDRGLGQHPVAVISYGLWKRRFDRREAAIGSKLQVGNQVLEVVGVAPAEFFGLEVGKIVDIWTPVSMTPAATLMDENMRWLRVMGRVKPGVSIAQAAAPMQAVENEAMLEDVRLHAPPGTPKPIIDRFLAGMRIKGVPAGGGISYLRSQYERPLQIVLCVVALVMLIACSNVANLLIAKGSARQQEIAIRLSLGAGRSRILQQLLTESFLLALLPAAVGLLLAHWMTPILVNLLTPSNAPAKLVTGIDLTLLTFTAVLVLVTVVICGLLPALRLSGGEMHAALKSGSRLIGVNRGRVRKILVLAQVALSLVLVSAAFLFTRTLLNLTASSLGFEPDRVIVTQISLQAPGNGKTLLPAWSELLRSVRDMPNVESASLSSASLFGGALQLGGLRTTASKALPTDPVAAELFVSASYFQTLKIKLVSGRDFQERDSNPDNTSVAIINEAFARKFFGAENPIGRKLTKMANDPLWTEIIAIVRDARYNNLREAAPPMIYIPYGRITDWIPPQGHPRVSMSLQVRGHQQLSSFANELRGAAAPRFSVWETSSQQQLIDDTLVRERLLAKVASLFGGLALLLAALGLYGIMSYAVVQRRQELGIRMALGAAPRSILHLMLWDSAMVVGLGVVIGILVAAASARLAKSLLYGLGPDDPPTLMAAATVLLAFSLLAAFIPAYRAAKTDPVVALRHE